jgi:CheY-like chemotaxis protein
LTLNGGEGIVAALSYSRAMRICGLRSMTAPHTVLLIDDNALIREVIAQLIEIRPSFRVVGKAGSMHQGVELAQRLAPEIILIDLHMPSMTASTR